MYSDINSRNFGLDLIRSLAILMVLTSHGRIFLPEFIYRDYLGIFGFLGVELFFILSGFLLGRILFKEFASKEFTLNTLKYFWVRRWLRTLPLYFIFLFLNIFILQYIFGYKEWNWTYFLFLQNFITSHPPMMPEAWSLSVEEWFYIFFPLFLFCILPIFQNKTKGFFYITLAYVCFFTCIRIYFAFEPNLEWDNNIRKIVSLRLDSIGYGVLTAYFTLNYKELIEKKVNIFYALGIIIIIITICLSIYFKYTSSVNIFFNKAFIFSMASIGFSLILLKLISCKSKNRLFVNTITNISLYSYAAYLFHLSIAIPLFKLFKLHIDSSFFTFIFYFVFVFFISSFIYKYIEAPFLELRGKIK